MPEGEFGNQPDVSSLWHLEQARNDVLYELRESSIRRDAAAVRRPADVCGARALRRRDAWPALGVGRGAAEANRPHQDGTSPAPDRRAHFMDSKRWVGGGGGLAHLRGTPGPSAARRQVRAR